jgi:hypothetical protein
MVDVAQSAEDTAEDRPPLILSGVEQRAGRGGAVAGPAEGEDVEGTGVERWGVWRRDVGGPTRRRQVREVGEQQVSCGGEGAHREEHGLGEKRCGWVHGNDGDGRELEGQRA